jgi:hypothetical protein
MPASKQLEIEKYHQQLNSPVIIEGSYYGSNRHAFELMTYINHVIACYYAKNFLAMTVFLCRAKKFLDVGDTRSINKEYREMVRKYLDCIQSYIFDLEDDYLIEKIKNYTDV